jgi:capsular exopolysaccharide synthesis family protein
MSRTHRALRTESAPGAVAAPEARPGLGPFVIYPMRTGPAAGSKAPPSFSDYLVLLWQHRWLILGAAAVAVLLAYVISHQMPRLYEATLTIDVDRQSTSGILNPEVVQNSPTDMDQFMATQIKLVQSDSVLRPVATKYHLLQEEQQFKGLPPERRQAAEQAPITLKQFKVNRPPNTYLLQLSYRNANPELASNVANAIAASYVEVLQRIRMRSWLGVSSFTDEQLAEIRSRMEQSGEELMRFEREIGMVNPDERTNIVSSRMVQINGDYAKATSDRAAKEAAYEAVRNGSLDSTLASPQGETLKRLIERRDDALQKFADIKSVFGENHPEYRRARALLQELEAQLNATRQNVVKRVESEMEESRFREANLRREFDRAKHESDQLNAEISKYRTLKEKADADRGLYNELVRKVGEAQITAGLQGTGVRVADPARASVKPVSPSVGLNCAAAFALAILLSVLGVIVFDANDMRVRTADDLRSASSSEVLGILPSVPAWRKRRSLSRDGSKTTLIHRRETSAGTVAHYDEAVRMLRSSLLAGASTPNGRCVLIASARRREGRSTTAANLAMSFAELGKRTVLVDADLVNPTLHTLFYAAPPKIGLVEVLKGEAQWKDVIVHQGSRPLLHLLPSGARTERGAELLNSGLPWLLEDLARNYDIVLVDSPAFLQNAQAVEIARTASSVLIVTRAGGTDEHSLQNLLAYLDRLNANVLGIVLNGA